MSLVIYVVPTMVAYYRNHRNAMAIFLLNLFTGWTFIGWVASPVWSASK